MKMVEELTSELLFFFNSFSSWESGVIHSGELTVAEAHAIEVLGQFGKMNMKSLAQKLGVSTGTTTVTVDKLEEKQYAKRETTKEDRRVNLISLTDKGAAAFHEHHKFHYHLTEQMLSVLSEEEANQLLAVLRKLNSEIFRGDLRS